MDIPNQIAESPFFLHPKPWWMPFFTLSLTLYGILFLHWHLHPIVFMFWWEVICMVGAALIRMLFALDGGRLWDNVFQRIFLLVGGLLMGGMFIVFSMVFTFKAFEGDMAEGSLVGIPVQTSLMMAGYVASLAIHFFANGRYRTASPAGELLSTLVQLWVLLAFLQLLTMHLIPRFPQLDQKVWVAVALVLLKFVVDLLFSRINQPFKAVFKGLKME